MSNIFNIRLEDTKGYDPLSPRVFTLPLDSTRYPVGRSSSSTLKKALAPSASNAYIDSPVISRQHAVLFANTSSGVPHVFISDCKSMHGTRVNGELLEPDRAYPLRHGDELQFGVDVNRNEEYFVARTYIFHADYAPAFSRGFTVPDAESDDDDIPITAHHGSQMNPVTLDDSDAGSDCAGEDTRDITMFNDVASSCDDPVIDVEVEVLLPEDEAGTSLPVAVVQDSYAEEQGDILVCSSDVDPANEQYMDMENDNSSITTSNKEVDYPSSEHEVPDSEEETDFDLFSGPTYEEDPGMDYLNQSAPHVDEGHKLPTPELPSFGSVFNPSIQDEDEPAPPLPPRPTSGELPQDSAKWHGDAGAAYLPLPDLVVPFQPDYLHSLPKIYDTCKQPCVQRGNCTTATPPPMPLTPPMPAADDATSLDFQPIRRTKVTIEEIVEEQPPTPTSVNELKRKADVFDEEDGLFTEAIMDGTNGAVSIDQPITTPPVADGQAPAVIAQRPKKQPRSILRRFGQTVKYPLLGAAGAVAAFTFLAAAPDAFFAV